MANLTTDEARAYRRLARAAREVERIEKRKRLAPREPAYIMRLREIAADPTTLPHVREHITAALADHDARRAAR